MDKGAGVTRPLMGALCRIVANLPLVTFQMNLGDHFDFETVSAIALLRHCPFTDNRQKSPK